MTHTHTHYYSIAGFGVGLEFSGQQASVELLLPSFGPFRQASAPDHLLFHVVVDDELKPFAKDTLEQIGQFDTGNGMTTVRRTPDCAYYQFIIKDINMRDCCLLQANHDFSQCKCALNGNLDMRRFGLNNALMLAFSFSASYKQTLLVHASLVRHNGYGYAFIAKSGTGKSTHVSLWLRHIPGCDLMNDDTPVVRIEAGQAFIYGSPWSGKTPCYRNTKARLGAITRIDRAKANSIERLNGATAFASLISSCSQMKWDKDIFNNVCDTITKVIETTGIYTLHCLPNEEAATLCHKAISK